MFNSIRQWLHARKVAKAWPLSAPLANLSKMDKFTIGDAVTGILILGSTGSGKSSGSGIRARLEFESRAQFPKRAHYRFGHGRRSNPG